MTATVSARGQTVIPAALRKRFGIKPNSKVEFLEREGEIVLVPVPKDPFAATWGILKNTGYTMEDFLRERREEGKRESARERAA